MDKLLPAFEESNMLYVFFLDYSACFNTLCRSIFYNKLDRYGLRGVSLDFLKAYFANRSQYVCYNTDKSPSKAKK